MVSTRQMATISSNCNANSLAATSPGAGVVSANTSGAGTGSVSTSAQASSSTFLPSIVSASCSSSINAESSSSLLNDLSAENPLIESSRNNLLSPCTSSSNSSLSSCVSGSSLTSSTVSLSQMPVTSSLTMPIRDVGVSSSSGSSLSARRCTFLMQSYQNSENDDPLDSEDSIPFGILHMPNEILMKIFSYLDYKTVGFNREVCQHFNKVGVLMLNSKFTELIKVTNNHFQRIKSMMPRRESARRNHPLACECDIVETCYMRLSLLQMTLGRHIERGHCCFFPGSILDEVLLIFEHIKNSPSLIRPYRVTDELFDLSTMAMEYFREHIEPTLPGISNIYKAYFQTITNTKKPPSVTSDLTDNTSNLSSSPPQSNMVLRKGIRKIKEGMKIYNNQLSVLRTELSTCKRKSTEQGKQIAEQQKLLAEQQKQALEYANRLDENDRKNEEMARKFSTLLQELNKCKTELQYWRSKSPAIPICTSCGEKMAPVLPPEDYQALINQGVKPENLLNLTDDTDNESDVSLNEQNALINQEFVFPDETTTNKLLSINLATRNLKRQYSILNNTTYNYSCNYNIDNDTTIIENENGNNNSNINSNNNSNANGNSNGNVHGHGNSNSNRIGSGLVIGSGSGVSSLCLNTKHKHNTITSNYNNKTSNEYNHKLLTKTQQTTTLAPTSSSSSTLLKNCKNYLNNNKDISSRSSSASSLSLSSEQNACQYANDDRGVDDGIGGTTMEPYKDHKRNQCYSTKLFYGNQQQQQNQNSNNNYNNKNINNNESNLLPSSTSKDDSLNSSNEPNASSNSPRNRGGSGDRGCSVSIVEGEAGSSESSLKHLNRNVSSSGLNSSATAASASDIINNSVVDVTSLQTISAPETKKARRVQKAARCPTSNSSKRNKY